MSTSFSGADPRGGGGGGGGGAGALFEKVLFIVSKWVDPPPLFEENSAEPPFTIPGFASVSNCTACR